MDGLGYTFRARRHRVCPSGCPAAFAHQRGTAATKDEKGVITTERSLRRLNDTYIEATHKAVFGRAKYHRPRAPCSAPG